MAVRAISIGWLALLAGGCGVIYTAPDVHDAAAGGGAYATDYDVQVVALSYESAAAANLVPYVPARLPLAYQSDSSAAAATRVSVPALPSPPPATARPTARPGFVADEFPPLTGPEPYKIGISDVLLLSVNGTASLENLPGLISAQSKRQGYIVQDDGAIAIPDAGRVRVAGMTLQDAEAEIFQALVNAGIDPSFSLEIAEFKSQRVSVGGMVAAPSLLPITLKPLYLHEAVQLAGGVVAPDPSTTRVQLFRDGQIYQIGLERFETDPATRRVALRDGDSIHVGSLYRADEARRYFEEQLQLRQEQLQTTNFQLQLAQLAGERQARERAVFRERLELGAVERHYAYRAGEVRQPGRVALPFERSMSLADVLFTDNGIDVRFGDYGEIYVIRAETDPLKAGGLTAFHLDAENAANLAVATQMQIRPNDVVFVAEQPVTSWNRALSQILPQIFISATDRLSGL